MYSGSVTSTDDVGWSTLLDVKDAGSDGDVLNTCCDEDTDVGVFWKLRSP